MHEVKRHQYCHGLFTKALKLQPLTAKASDFGDSQCPQQHHFRHIHSKVEQLEYINQYYLGVFPSRVLVNWVQVSTLLGVMWFHRIHRNYSSPLSFSGHDGPVWFCPVR